MQSNAVLVHDMCQIVYLTSYDNQLLCQYNIDCGEGQQAYINLVALDLQGDGDCSYKGMPRYASYTATSLVCINC